MKASKKRGFTIVELIIVIAVIAILAAVLIPTFSNLINKAQQSVDKQAVTQMNTALYSDEILDGACETPAQVRQVLSENGFNTTFTTTYAGYTMMWYKTKNRIVLVDLGKNVVYPEEFKEVSQDDLKSLTNISYDIPLDENINQDASNLDYVIDENSKTITINTTDGYVWFANKTGEKNVSYTGYDITLKENAVFDFDGLTIPQMYLIRLVTEDGVATKFQGSGTCNVSTFDGNGATLKNFEIHKSSISPTLAAYKSENAQIIHAGLFGNIYIYGNGNGSQSLTIRGFTVENGYIYGGEFEGTYLSAGVLAGYCNTGTFENITVKNCQVVGTYAVGGLIGLGCGDSISNCAVTGCTIVATGNEMAGGLVAWIGSEYGPSSISITNCTITDNKTKSGEKVGGLTAKIYYNGKATSNSLTVTGCTIHNNTLSGNDQYTGNIYGKKYGSPLDNVGSSITLTLQNDVYEAMKSDLGETTLTESIGTYTGTYTKSN